MITGECQCAERCGRPAGYHGPAGAVLSEACNRRWLRAGSPPEGVPAPRSRITGTCQCAPWCGRPARSHGPAGMVLSKSCHRRWVKAGRPAEPVPAAEQAPPKAAPPPIDWDEPDPAEIAARWEWFDPRQRQNRAIPVAGDLARMAQIGPDRQGVEILLGRFTDWGAVMMVLAFVADREKLAALAGAAGEGKAA